MLLFLLCTTIFLLGFDLNETEEMKIMATINQMVDSINEKDAQRFISVLNDHFIKETYGNKKYIENNIQKFGNITSVYIYYTSVKSYYAVSYYYLTYEARSGWCSDFNGIILLEKVNNDWKIHSVSEEEINSSQRT